MAAGQLGRKTGAGSTNTPDGRRGAVAPEFRATRATSHAGSCRAAEITSRILDAIDAEARRALADGVATESDIDLRCGSVPDIRWARSSGRAAGPADRP